MAALVTSPFAMQIQIPSLKPFRSSLIRWLVVVSLAALPSARALTPQVSKLHNRSGANQVGANFGDAVAVSDAWILIGVPKQQASGAVQVFSAQTGRFVRTLLPQTGDTAGAAFGTSVAVSGNRAVVGAPENDGGRGVAYVFDLTKGTRLFRFVSPTPVAGVNFGRAVAIGADRVAVSEPGDNSGRGAVHLFDARTGNLALPKLAVAVGQATPGDNLGISLALNGRILAAGAPAEGANAGAVYLFETWVTTVNPPIGRLPFRRLAPAGVLAGDRFGASLSVDGPRVLVGAPGDAASKGAAYVFHYPSGTELPAKLVAGNGVAGDKFGSGVALSGDLALVGAPDRSGAAGAAYLFEPESGVELRQLTASDGKAGKRFGERIALCNTLGVAGAPNDDDLATNAGAAYFFRPLAGPRPFLTLAKSRDFAPGVVDADFGTFFHPAINSLGETVFGATLTGPGSNRNRDRGVWSDLPGVVRPLGRSRDDLSTLGGSFAGLRIGTVTWPVFDQDNFAVFSASLTGAGVSTANNRAILGNNGAALNSLARTGDAVVELTGAPRLLAIPEVLQTRAPSTSRVVLPYTLNTRLGGATASTDSGVLVVNADGAVQDFDAREGEDTNGSGKYAQFFGRAVAGNDAEFYGYPAFRIPPLPAVQTVARQALFVNRFNGLDTFATGQEEDAPGVAGAKVKALLGEGIDTEAWLLYRATITGGGATKANDEGLWHENVADAPLLRKGDTPLGLPAGVVVSRFLSFWPVDTKSALVLVRLAGTGVKASNDVALILVQDDGVDNRRLLLLREGDAVGEPDSPLVGVIQRVEVEPVTGRYLVLASLTGSAARNQALFVGNATAGNNIAGRAARLPQLRLRKGRRYDTGYSDATTIRSIVIEPRVDRTGAGAKGLGSVLNPSGEGVVLIEFENKARELVTGMLAR
jgi:hypothetical protein